MARLLKHPITLIAILLLGLLTAQTLISNKPTPTTSESQLPPKLVDVIITKKSPFRSQVTGYGYVEPSINLPIKAEVTGKVSYLHPKLKRGARLPEGEVVIRIDPEDYQVSLHQSEADLASSRYTLEQLQEQEKTIQRSLDLANKNLAVGEKELGRVRTLFERGLVAKSSLDSEEQKVIQLEQQVADLEGQLRTNRSSERVETAKFDRAEQGVKGQQQTLGRTEIVMPFNARIGEVSIENGEFVTAGTALFEALDVKGVEIEAAVSSYDMFALVSHLSGRELSETELFDDHSLSQLLGLQATVSVVDGVRATATWEARVLRLAESVSQVRRTIGIVVGIDNPYEKIIPGKRPPLLKGMYVAVDFLAPAWEAIVIPRRALHEGRVYTVSEDNRLKIVPVEVGLIQNDQVVIRSGLEEGTAVIINDLVPAIEGMPVSRMNENPVVENTINENPIKEVQHL